MGLDDAAAIPRQTVAPSASAARREPGRALTYLALWSPVAIGFALALAIAEKLSWSQALVAGVMSTVPAALLGLAVESVVVRLATVRVAGAALIHLVAGAAFSALWCAAIVSEVAIFATRRDVVDFLQAGSAWQLVMGVIVYAVLVGIENVQLGREREREQQNVIEKSETLRLRAELSALRSRLDPHFLFNALQTLGALVNDRPSDAHRALEYLASLLRRRLDNVDEATDLATLDDELMDAREYLELQRLSLGDRLRVTEQVDAETRQLLLPRFTIQPLLENAIRHGIGPRRSGGCIAITTSRCAPDSWTLEIEDDGVGDGEHRAGAGLGIGLATVHERVRLHFGPHTHFDVAAPPSGGWTVTIGLPAATDEESLMRAEGGHGR